jgi:predicted nucleic acid-binding protein
LVLDASATGPLILNDEKSAALPGLVEVLANGGACVPAHWHLEVANSVRTASIRGRLDESGQADAIALVQSIILEIDELTREMLFDATWRLAERHGLTIYDAAYLELAQRRELPLATHDKALMTAARHESVALFGR